MNNVILCGFMGCGKSTVGKNIARKTGRHFIDMDRYIEQKAGMTVAEIFASKGEEGFRALEHEACRELADRRGTIRFRLRNDKKRPLLQRPDRDKVMEELYRKRLPQYRAAADVVVRGESTPLKTAMTVIERLGLKKKTK